MGGTEPVDRETAAMEETLNRIARFANSKQSNVMVIIDQVNEKTRAERIPRMYSHILGRASQFREMRRIVEPPMHVDSKLSANIQFADWIAACVTRAIDYQLIDSSRYSWVVERDALPNRRNAFTVESKLHLWHSSIDDIKNAQLFNPHRTIQPSESAIAVNTQQNIPWEAMRAAAVRQQSTQA